MLLADIDLEIALKQRLADTIESRIAWALILQETLQKGAYLNCCQLSGVSPCAKQKQIHLKGLML